MKPDLALLEDRYLERCTAPNSRLDTKSKLLEAAVTLFAKHGYGGASLRDITTLAGVKHGSIQYHYESKEALWKAAVAFLYDLMLEALKADDAVGDNLGTPLEARQHMISMTRAYIQFNAKHPELFRILTYESMNEGPRLDWIVDNYTKPLFEKSDKRISQAKAAGVYPKDVPNLNLFYISMTAGRTFFLLAPEIKRAFGVDVFDEDALQKHVDAVVALIYK